MLGPRHAWEADSDEPDDDADRSRRVAHPWDVDSEHDADSDAAIPETTAAADFISEATNLLLSRVLSAVTSAC